MIMPVAYSVLTVYSHIGRKLAVISEPAEEGKKTVSEIMRVGMLRIIAARFVVKNGCNKGDSQHYCNHRKNDQRIIQYGKRAGSVGYTADKQGHRKGNTAENRQYRGT